MPATVAARGAGRLALGPSTLGVPGGACSLPLSSGVPYAVPRRLPCARSSVDRALASGARGRKFESCRARRENACGGAGSGLKRGWQSWRDVGRLSARLPISAFSSGLRRDISYGRLRGVGPDHVAGYRARRSARSCACLLGAGVSVDADVPTGWGIFQDRLRRLYQQESETSTAPAEEELAAWLKERGYDILGYSSLLDLITPDPAVRRQMLAGYFDGVDPGPAHELAAPPDKRRAALASVPALMRAATRRATSARSSWSA
jgi:hypothetical protein